MPRPAAELEHRVAGQAADLLDAGNGRHDRRGAGREHEAAGAYFRIACDEPSRPVKRASALMTVTPSVASRSAETAGADRRDGLAGMRHHGLEIDLGLGLDYAEPGACPHRLRAPCGGDQRPGGEGAAIEVAAAGRSPCRPARP